MDVERALISKMLRTRCWQRVIELGITLEHFEDNEHNEAAGYIAEHYSQYGKSMTLDAFKQNLPSYKVIDTPEAIEWYVDQVKHRKKYGLLQEMLADATDAVEDDDVDEAARIISLGMTEVAKETMLLLDHDITKEWRKRLAQYNAWIDDPGLMRGIPTGYLSVDTTTRGLQPGNLITIVGPPGVGKTTLQLSIARHIHNDGFKVLMVTFEMPYEELATRYDAQRAKLDHHKLLGGRIKRDSKEYDRLVNKMRRDENNENFIISEDITQATTVSGLQAKLQLHKPDVLFVDGVYMMQDEYGEPFGSPQALTNISRSLARMAKLEEIPVCITTQALFSKMRGGKVNLGSIGYTSAFAQDSHVVLGLYMDPEDKTAATLDTLKSRNGPQITATLEWNWKDAKFLEVMNDWDEDGGGGASQSA